MSEDKTPEDHMIEAEEEAALADAEALRAEVAALKEQVLRFAADAENTRRRAEREANDARAYAIQKFARDLLGVADNLTNALAAEPAQSGDPVLKNFLVGVEMVQKELLSAFEKNGLKRIDPKKGDRFDPHQHQAMMEQPSTEVAAGGVIQVFQPGYELLGRLVRPAMVVVAAKGSTAPAATGPYAANDETDGSGGNVDTRA